MRVGDLLQQLGRPVAYFPAIAKLVGVKETVLLCQLLYWDGKQSDPEGWIFKSQDEIGDETGLSGHEQRTARKRLRQLGLIEENLERLNHRMLYRVSKDRLSQIWESRTSSVPELHNLHSGGSTTLTPGTPQPSLRLTTESTSEITPYISEGEKEGKIYDSYPRKASREHAIRAIRKALKNYQFEYLLDRTLKFAAAREGKDQQYTPHPATWFNGERFKDPEEEWERPGAPTNGLASKPQKGEQF